MKRVFSPRVIIPLVLGLGIIVVLLGYADIGRVLRAAGAFRPIYLLLILALTVVYEALRAVQWYLFLRVLDHREPWRACVMSYMGGEMAKVLPGGQYFQTYLLRQAQGFPIACSIAATTIIIWLEVVVSLIIVLLLGVSSWTWVRPVALALLFGIGIVVALIKRRPLSARFGDALQRRERLRAAWEWYNSFAGCAGALLRPRVIGVAVALSAGYIVCGALELWTIAAALGQGIGPGQALVVYAFALSVGLVIPIPIDLGLTELSGLAALVAFGVDRADALTMVLIQRVLSTILTAGIAALSLLVLRRQVVTTLHAGPHLP